MSTVEKRCALMPVVGTVDNAATAGIWSLLEATTATSGGWEGELLLVAMTDSSKGIDAVRSSQRLPAPDGRNEQVRCFQCMDRSTNSTRL